MATVSSSTTASSASTAASTASTASTRSSLKVSGLVSGIDSGAIVDALINADAGPKRVLENQRTLLDARRQAVRTLNTKLLSASLDLSRLKLSSTFGARTADSSQPESVTATAGATAQPGTYEFTVVSTAKAHQLATAGRASNTSAVGAGTITLQLGNGAAKQVAIDGSASSLNDIAAAINAAGAGVSASVVNQGGATPYRLVLQGQKTGTENAMLVSGTGAMSGLFAGMSTLTNAADAQIAIGADSPVTISSSSNQVTTVIPGATLNLLKASAGPVRLTIGQDSSAVVDAVKTFVESANDAITYLNDNSRFDPETQQGGILIAESGIKRNMQSMIRALTGTVAAAGSSTGSLAAVGVTLDRDSGLLELDEAKLKEKLASDSGAVAKLFTNTGTASVNSVKFAALNAKTRTDRPFAIEITQAAAQAALGGTGDLAAATVITGANNRLELAINGTVYSAAIPDGTYTRDELATAVGRAVGGLTGNGDQVSIGLDGLRLEIRSRNFGSNQSVQVLSSSSALAALGLAASRVTGADVKGSIDGQAVTGSGQVLFGKAGTSSEGLAMTVTATAPVAGVTLTASKGLAQLADEQIKALTDVERGVLTQRDKTIQDNMSSLSASIKRKEALLTARREAYERRFIAMEKSIATLQSQGNYLSSQIASFNKASSSS